MPVTFDMVSLKKLGVSGTGYCDPQSDVVDYAHCALSYVLQRSENPKCHISSLI